MIKEDTTQNCWENYVVDVYDINGNKKVVDNDSLRILSETKRVDYILIIKKIIFNLNLVFAIFLVGLQIKKILGKSLTTPEHNKFLKFLGYDSKLLIIKSNNLKFKFDITQPVDLMLILDSFLPIVIRNTYNVSNKMKNKVVIDAGANIGIFSIYAAKLGAKKVYAFEPVKETYEMLVKNIKLNNCEKQIIAINKALGDKNQIKNIGYRCGGDCGASIAFKKPINIEKEFEKIEKTQVVTIDSSINEKIDFIKIDTEGYEEKVLIGAKKTIKKYKPILSFSAYHNPEDKVTLPKIVKSIRPDYKIKLNNFGEEDFYCE